MKRRIIITLAFVCAAGILYAYYQGRSVPAFGAATIAPDNKTFVFSYASGDHCYMYRAIIGQATASRVTTASSGCEANPAFSPDGKLIAYSYSKAGERKSQILVVNADGTGQRQITKPSGEGDDVYPVFAPSGDKIIFVRSGFFGNFDGINADRRHKFNAYSADLAGNLTQLTSENFYDVSQPAITPDGTHFVFKVFDYAEKGDAFVEYSTDGMSKSPVATWHPDAGKTQLGHSYGDFLFLPDGKSAILTSASEGKSGSYDYDLYRLNLSDQTVQALTTDNGYVTGTAVSPNGKFVIFSRRAITNSRSLGASSLHLLDIASHKITDISLLGMQ